MRLCPTCERESCAGNCTDTPNGTVMVIDDLDSDCDITTADATMIAPYDVDVHPSVGVVAAPASRKRGRTLINFPPGKKPRLQGCEGECQLCGKTKPGNMFPLNGQTCTACKNTRGKARRMLRKARVALGRTKECEKCGEEKPEAVFRAAAAESPDREVSFKPWCLECELESGKAHIAEPKGPQNPPPDDWHSEDPPEKRAADWAALDCPGRVFVRIGARMREERVIENRTRVTAKAMAAVEAGGKNAQRYKTYLERGGVMRYATTEEREAAQQASYAAKVVRRSAELLHYRLLHCGKCMDPECTIDWRVKQADGTMIEAEPIVSLFEFDHDDPSTKVAVVTTLIGDARDMERLKTTSRCLTCHAKRTQKQRGRRTTVCAGAELKLRKHKLSVGCQHPHHSAMPYAKAVEEWGGKRADSYAVYEVAHTLLGTKPRTKPSQGEKCFDVMNGKARILCLFCHQLWTVCERFNLSPTTPLTKHDYDVVDRYYPEFTRHFAELTSGFDWKTETTRRNLVKSVAHQRRHINRAARMESDDTEAE